MIFAISEAILPKTWSSAFTTYHLREMVLSFADIVL
jgi:hypothetical protein